MEEERLMFVYGEPALVVTHNDEKHLVVGDLHIGVERRLMRRGLRIFSATDRMAERVRNIAREFGSSSVIVIGDVKDSILYPDVAERRLLRSFFDALSDMEVTIVAGNHDAHLGEVVDNRIVREMRLGGFAFLHGDKNPSDDSMHADYIITAHNHAIVRMRDENSAIYEEKVWLVAGVNKSLAKRRGISINKNVKMIAMPAFNELVAGTPVGKSDKGILSPAMRSGLFSYKRAQVYNLRGEPINRKSGLVITYNDY